MKALPLAIRPSTVMTNYATAIRAHRLALLWTWVSGFITGIACYGLFA